MPRVRPGNLLANLRQHYERGYPVRYPAWANEMDSKTVRVHRIDSWDWLILLAAPTTSLLVVSIYGIPLLTVIPVLAGVGFISAMIYSVRYSSRIRRITCPECGEVSPRDDNINETNATMQYSCKKCKIIWDSQLGWPSSDMQNDIDF